jgi:hypothetical protein
LRVPSCTLPSAPLGIALRTCAFRSICRLVWVAADRCLLAGWMAPLQEHQRQEKAAAAPTGGGSSSGGGGSAGPRLPTDAQLSTAAQLLSALGCPRPAPGAQGTTVLEAVDAALELEHAAHWPAVRLRAAGAAAYRERAAARRRQLLRAEHERGPGRHLFLPPCPPDEELSGELEKASLGACRKFWKGRNAWCCLGCYRNRSAGLGSAAMFCLGTWGRLSTFFLLPSCLAAAGLAYTAAVPALLRP